MGVLWQREKYIFLEGAMYKSDRNITIGLWGMLGSMIMFFVSLFLMQFRGESILYPLIFAFLCLFFMGYMFGGLFTGIIFSIGLLGVMGITWLISWAGSYLESTGILPGNKRGLVLLIFMLLLAFGLNLYKIFWVKKKNKRNSLKKVSNVKLKGKRYRKSAERNNDDKQLDAIFLILPRWIRTDIVYKAIFKDNNIYFCRVGGQFYEIRGIQNKYNARMNEKIFVGDKNNFKVAKHDIVSVVINTKKSMWTGKISNNGTVILSLVDGKEKLIIHPIQNARTVYEFFKSISGIPVELIDKEEKAKESSLKKNTPSVNNRSAGYKMAKRLTNILNNLAFMSAMWMIFYPKPYVVVLIVNLALPIIGIIIYIKFKDYVEFDDEKGRDCPNVGMVVLFPSIFLSFRAIFDFNVIYTGLLWVYLIVITIIILIIILLKSKEYKTKKWLPVIMFIFIFSYVYGGVITTNCVFDYSKPIKYTTYVEDKHKTKGKVTSYYLKVRPWGPYNENNEVDVSKRLYENTEKGDRVRMLLFDGAWGIRWFGPIKYTIE